MIRYECRLAWLYLSDISLFYCVHTVFYLPLPTYFFLLPFSDAVGISAAFFFYLSFLPVNFMTLPRLMPSVMLPTYTTFLDTIERNFLHLFRGQFYTTT